MTTEQQEREAPQAEIEGRLYAWQMACGCRFVYRIELPTADQQPVFLTEPDEMAEFVQDSVWPEGIVVCEKHLGF